MKTEWDANDSSYVIRMNAWSGCHLNGIVQMLRITGLERRNLVLTTARLKHSRSHRQIDKALSSHL